MKHLGISEAKSEKCATSKNFLLVSGRLSRILFVSQQPLKHCAQLCMQQIRKHQINFRHNSLERSCRIPSILKKLAFAALVQGADLSLFDVEDLYPKFFMRSLTNFLLFKAKTQSKDFFVVSLSWVKSIPKVPNPSDMYITSTGVVS